MFSVPYNCMLTILNNECDFTRQKRLQQFKTLLYICTYVTPTGLEYIRTEGCEKLSSILLVLIP